MQAKRKKHLAVILTVALMATVFVFLVYLNQRPYAHIETHTLGEIQAEAITQTIAQKLRLDPEALCVRPSGKISFDVDANGKFIRPLQLDIQGIEGENLQTGTLLLRGQGLYLYRNQTEKLAKAEISSPLFTQDIPLDTFLSALNVFPIAQAALQAGGEESLFYSVEWVYDAEPSDASPILLWKDHQLQVEKNVSITNRETQCFFIVTPHTGRIRKEQAHVQVIVDLGV